MGKSSQRVIAGGWRVGNSEESNGRSCGSRRVKQRLERIIVVIDRSQRAAALRLLVCSSKQADMGGPWGTDTEETARRSETRLVTITAGRTGLCRQWQPIRK